MLSLSKQHVDELVAHSRLELPNEACGMLAGRDGKAERVYRMSNIDSSPATYFMEPREQFAVMKEIRSLGLEMVGIYHSHVHSEARPSARDVELAFYPEVSYVIISLADEEVPGVRSFRIAGEDITEEELKIS